MIALNLSAASDAPLPFVTRLGFNQGQSNGRSRLESSDGERSLWCGSHGLLEIFHRDEFIEGDVVLVYPGEMRAERLIRANSAHNTLLVTEQCDQLCIMCSQPPKKTHLDRFDHFIEACLLADEGMTIGISGGEPTLHMAKLLGMIECVGSQRPDLSFHVLSNAQHFEREHVEQLRDPRFSKVVWGIPLYSCDPARHDAIVGKVGAFERLIESFRLLLLAGTRIELRTVLMSENVDQLPGLADFIAANLPHVEQWSIMDLENAGFARQRFAQLRVDLPDRFDAISPALDRAILHGIPVKLFNVPLCHVPPSYRHLAVASISDWKQRFAKNCHQCSAKPDCAGFFEWHPEELIERATPI